MIADDWPEIMSLIDELWPQYAGNDAGGKPKFPSEQQKVVCEGLLRFDLEAVLAAFRNHRLEEPDLFKPKFKVVRYTLRAEFPMKERQWRDEDGRTEEGLLHHLQRQKEAGARVLEEAGEDAVNRGWEKHLSAEIVWAAQNRFRQPVVQMFKRDGPHKWPVFAAMAVNPKRFTEIMQGGG